VNILFPVRFHISNSIVPLVWDKCYGTVQIPALTCYLSLLPILLGLGVAWSDSCEKEYLNTNSPGCAGSWLSPLADLMNSPSLVFFLFLGFYIFLVLFFCSLSWNWRTSQGFPIELFVYIILSNVSQLGQLGGESGWGRLRGDSHESQQVFIQKTRVFLQSPSILTTDSATHITNVILDT